MNFENYEYEVKYGLAKILSYTGKEKEIVIPEKINGKNVYTICSHAFLDLKDVETIIIPKSVGCIEDFAICACGNLKKIELPIVEELGNFIKDCSQQILVETKSPRMACKVERMYSNINIYCEKDFKYSITDEKGKECRIDRVRFRGPSLSLPDEIDGYKVTSLGFTLDSNKKFKAVKLPRFLKSIPNSFLNGQYGLEVFEYGDCIESIGTYAFYGTAIKNVEEFVIPKKVKKVGRYAFAEAKFKVSFEEGSELEAGDYAFSCINVDASNLKKIILAPGVFYKSVVSNLSLKKDNTVIPNSTFRKATLKELRGFSKIREIGSYAFAEMTMDKKINLNLSNVTNVGANAFMYMDVESIHIPKGFKLTEGLFSYSKASKVTFDKDFDGQSIPRDCFRNMINLKHFEMPESIREIGYCAFYCAGLLENIFLKNIEVIDRSAFANTGLKEAFFGPKLSVLEYGSFTGSALEKVVFEESPLNIIPSSCFHKCIKLKEVVLTKNISIIDNSAFADDSSLININLEYIKSFETNCFHSATMLKEAILTAAKEIGYSAFSYCQALEKVILGNSLEYIGDYAFRNCTKIANLNFPDSLKEFGDGSLQGTSIEEFVMPKNMTSLYSGLFYGASKLRKVVLNDFITEIPYNCFNNTGIEEIILGNNVKAINSSAIYCCGKLTKLVIPESVKHLRHDCIQYCPNLEEVHILGTLDTLNTGVFAGCSKLKKIHTDDFVSGKKLISRSSTYISEIVPIKKTLPKKRTRKAKTA